MTAAIVVASPVRRLPVKRRAIAGVCSWVFRSGWAMGMVCGATAWYDHDGEPRCKAHRQAAPHG